MSASTPERATSAATPCLTAGPLGGRIISVLFVVTIVLFVLAVATFGPMA